MVKFLVTEPLGMVAVSHLSYEGYRGSGSITDPLGVVAAGCARSQGVREVASSQSQTPPPPHTHIGVAAVSHMNSQGARSSGLYPVAGVELCVLHGKGQKLLMPGHRSQSWAIWGQWQQ